jgi:hypothetical protein
VIDRETAALDPYVVWQNQQALPLFHAGGTWWRPYREVLVPASLKPEPTHLKPTEAQDLLRESRAYLLRFFTGTADKPTEFWYTLCDDYNFEKLPGKMRTKIRRAYKDCVVRQVQPAWLAENGYDCYLAAFSRYKGGKANSSDLFRKLYLACVDGPFEFWGAFVGDNLAAFAKCVVGRDYVAMVVFKIDPKYSTSRPAYALQDSILQAYVAKSAKPVNNGFRSLDHDTNMQDFVLQFGFRRVYTDLRVVYRPVLQSFVDLLYPFKSIIGRLSTPSRIASVKTLLRQEQIRRSCLEPQI